MQLRKLGRSGLRVAALCLGGNTFGWTTDQTASEAVLDAYVEAGGNFIDTADVYSRWAPGHQGGESEAVLGSWMAARRNRHAVIIATKVMAPMGPGPNDTRPCGASGRTTSISIRPTPTTGTPRWRRRCGRSTTW